MAIGAIIGKVASAASAVGKAGKAMGSILGKGGSGGTRGTALWKQYGLLNMDKGFYKHPKVPGKKQDTSRWNKL